MAAAFALACSAEGTNVALGAGGDGGGGGLGGGGVSNNVAGVGIAGSGVTTGGTVGTAGHVGSAGANGGGAGGAGGAGGGGAGVSGGGAGGTVAAAGAAGMAGSAGSGGTAPVCMVPVSGGADFSGLLIGRKSAEAETTQLVGATAASNGTGWTGTGFADLNGGEGSMTWLIDAPANGLYVLDWRYAQADTRDMRLTVNCAQVGASVAFANTTSWNSKWVTGGSQKVTLRKGTNKILLETNGGSGPNFDSLLISPPTCTLAGDVATTCEAERALLSGAASVLAAGSGWKDLGFADMNGSEGGVNWVFDAPYAGTYTLTFVYAQADTRDMKLSVNGAVELQSLPFNNTKDWNNVWLSDVTHDVTLKAGLNSVQLATNGASGPNFDSVMVHGHGAGGSGGGGAGGAAGTGGGGASSGGAGGSGGGGAGSGGTGGGP